MMTWACLVHPLLPGPLQRHRAGQALARKQPLSRVGAAKIGKPLWEKPLGEAGAAHNRSDPLPCIVQLHVFCSCQVCCMLGCASPVLMPASFTKDLHKALNRLRRHNRNLTPGLLQEVHRSKLDLCHVEIWLIVLIVKFLLAPSGVDPCAHLHFLYILPSV